MGVCKCVRNYYGYCSCGRSWIEDDFGCVGGFLMGLCWLK